MLSDKFIAIWGGIPVIGSYDWIHFTCENINILWHKHTQEADIASLCTYRPASLLTCMHADAYDHSSTCSCASAILF